MADIAASANDPIFLNHHAMVDCIFETWLQNNPNAQYPQSDEIPQGHGQQDYIVPFFPLFTHQEMFSTAATFGYRCRIKSPMIQSNNNSKKLPGGEIAGIVVGSIVGAVIFAGIYCCYHYYKTRKIPYLKM
jgi:hypothetical protein